MNSAFQPLPVSALATFLISVAINYFLGKDTGKKDPMSIAPPGYFFAIWGVIYLLFLGLLIFLCFYGRLPDECFYYLIAISALNATWIVFSWSDLSFRLPMMLVILLALVASCGALWLSIPRLAFDSDVSYIVAKNIVSFYWGWVTAASVLNLCLVLKYNFGVGDLGLLRTFWIVAPIWGVIMFVLMAKRGLGEIGYIGFLLSFGWAIIGVIKSKDKVHAPLY